MSSPEYSYVYVIEDEHGTVKIGIAGNPEKRINTIDKSIPYQIINKYKSPVCTNAREIEKAAHKHFAKRRKKGEWFAIAFDDAVDYVKGHFVTQQLTLPVGQSAELNREFNGIKISQRTNDNYLDATAMCKATGKLFGHYKALDSTQAFLNALSLKTEIPIYADIGYPISEQNQGLVQTIKGGNSEKQGSWVHPQVSINLAQWCSPEFAVMVTEWVFELMTKGHVSLNKQPVLIPEQTIQTIFNLLKQDAQKHDNPEIALEILSDLFSRALQNVVRLAKFENRNVALLFDSLITESIYSGKHEDFCHVVGIYLPLNRLKQNKLIS